MNNFCDRFYFGSEIRQLVQNGHNAPSVTMYTRIVLYYVHTLIIILDSYTVSLLACWYTVLILQTQYALYGIPVDNIKSVNYTR